MRRQQSVGGRGSAATLARIRREARASLRRLRRAGLESIRAIDEQIKQCGEEQEAVRTELRRTLASISEAANIRETLSRRPHGGSAIPGASPTERVSHLRLVGGPRWRVAPETVTLREMERDHIAVVLARCGWNQSRAALQLGIGRNTLMRKVKTFRLRKIRRRSTPRGHAGGLAAASRA